MKYVNEFPSNLQHYIYYALNRETKPGYLALLDSAFNSDKSVFDRSHNVWETAIWMQVAGLKLCKINGEHKILSEKQINNTMVVLEEKLRPCSVQIHDSGLFTYIYSKKGKYRIYERENAEIYESWINKALPEFYIKLTHAVIKD